MVMTLNKRINRTMPDLADFVTTQEAAVLLQVHVESVRRLLREKDLEGRKVGYMWLVSKSSIRQYLKETENMGKFDPRRGNQ